MEKPPLHEAPEKVFAHYFEHPLTKVVWEDLPKEVEDFLEQKSALRVYPDERKKRNFLSVWETSIGGDPVYIGFQRKISTNFEGGVRGEELLVHLIRMRDGKEVSHGSIMQILKYTNHEDGKETLIEVNNPFPTTDFIGVHKDFRGQGAAYEQLRLMNALSHMLFDSPLYSSTWQTPEGEQMTKKAVARGMAVPSEKYEGRYVYITTATGTEPVVE